MNLEKIIFLLFLHSSLNFLVADHLYSEAFAFKAPKNSKQSHLSSVSNKPADLKNHTHFSTVKLVTPYQILPRKIKNIPIGLWVTLNKGWYSYWKNPGESGKPLKIKWILPKGNDISDFNWPIPERTQFRTFTNFVYKDDFLLISEWSLPKKKIGEQIHIKAQVEWLICKEVCIPLTQETHLKLPVEPLSSNKTQKNKYPENISSPSHSTPHSSQSEARTKNKEKNTKQTINTYWQSIFDKWSKKIPEIVKKNIIIQETNTYWKADFTTDKKLQLLDVFPLSNNLFSLQTPEIISAENYQHSFHIRKSDFQNSAKSSNTNKSSSSPLKKKTNNADTHTANKKTQALVVFHQTQMAMNEYSKNTRSKEKKTLPEMVTNRKNKVGILYTFMPKSESILWFLILAFLGGILLNLMPCVLPIVFLKFSNTLEQSKQKTLTVVSGNLCYSAGVISSFLLLAILLLLFKKGGESIGWGFQMQSPYFLLSIIFLFVLISFGFMGWLSVSLPSLPFFHSGQNNFKHFLTGVLSTTSASPCTAPFMGASIGYALSSDTFQAIMIFLFLGIGLSFPYLLLSVFPKWIKYIPTPGNWSHKLKHFMAFPMLITSAWLIHLFNRQKPSALLPVLLGLLFMALGFWILNNLKRRTWLTGLSRVIILTGLIYPFFHLYGESKLNLPGINWQKFSLNKMRNINDSGQALFINFTADWCLTCKFNEQITFKNKKVIKFFSQNQIHSLKGDWTNKNREITEVLNNYHRSGIPFYLYFPPSAEPSSGILLPELLTPGLLLKYLNKQEVAK